MSNIKSFGDRVVVEIVEEEYDGMLFVQERRNSAHHAIARVVCESPKLKDVGVGDIVWFQFNKVVSDSCAFVCDGSQKLSLHYKDVLGKLSSTKITVDSLTMVGAWVLVKPFLNAPKSGIIIPDTAKESSPEHVRFALTKCGESASDVKQHASGVELVLNKNYVNRIDLGGESYAYISQDNVLAAIE